MDQVEDLRNSNLQKNKAGVRAMLLAAGLGTRLKPWTDSHPKALARVNGKSLLQLNIEFLQRHGIREVVVNVHHFADQIVDAIEANNGWGSNIIISDETKEVLETGGGLMKAAPHLSSSTPFVLMNVDILTDLNLTAFINYHIQTNALATLATTNRETSRYFLFDENNNLVGWRNVKTGEEKPSSLSIEPTFQKAFSGLHVVNPSIFGLVKQQGKFSMVDVYLDLMSRHTIKCYDHSDRLFIDVGKPDSIEKAEKMFTL